MEKDNCLNTCRTFLSLSNFKLKMIFKMAHAYRRNFLNRILYYHNYSGSLSNTLINVSLMGPPLLDTIRKDKYLHFLPDSDISCVSGLYSLLLLFLFSIIL